MTQPFCPLFQSKPLPLIGGESFFDGFGFAPYRKRFGWREEILIDRHEKEFPPRRPLLPFFGKAQPEAAEKMGQQAGPLRE